MPLEHRERLDRRPVLLTVCCRKTITDFSQLTITCPEHAFRHALPLDLAPEKSVEQAAVAEGVTGPAVVPLGRGRSVEVHAERDVATLRIRGEGERDLTIEIGFAPDGPVLRVKAARLELQSAREVSVSCETFQVNARQRIDLPV